MQIMSATHHQPAVHNGQLAVLKLGAVTRGPYALTPHRRLIDSTHMFKHIVMWKLQESAGGRNRGENARLIKERFEELANMLDGLRHLEVGIDVLQTDASADVVLYTEFESRTDYEAYNAHPAHKAIAEFIQGVRSERRVIDYEA